jgi:hypothetical protein
MKKLFLSFFVFAGLGFAQPAKVCQLGMDPVDTKKNLNRDTEVLVKIESHQQVLMGTGSGRKVRCILPPGTAVVADRASGIARWVYSCGNTIFEPAGWVPQGVREDFLVVAQPEQPKLVEQQPSPQPLKVEGEVRHVGEIEVRHSGEVVIRQVQEKPVEMPKLPPTPPKKGWWQKNRKWVIPLAILGGGVAAYAATKGGGNNTTIYYQPLPPPIKR